MPSSMDEKTVLRAILDRIDEAVLLTSITDLLDPDFTAEFVSSGYEAIWGEPLAAIAETNPQGFFDTLHPDDRDDYQAFLESIAADAATGDVAERYATEYRIEHTNGDTRWVHTDVYPLCLPDETPRAVVVSRDVTVSHRRERTLDSFHIATKEITSVDTPDEACQLAMRAAADVFGVDCAAVFRYEDGRLEPTAVTPPSSLTLDALPRLDADQSTAWSVFATEQPVRRTATNIGWLPIDREVSVSILPLGEHGIVVWIDEDSPATEVSEAEHVVAATLEGALNHLRGRRALRDRQQRLEAQTRRASRLSQLTDLAYEIETAVTNAQTREEMERAVCERLAAADRFVSAWIGAVEVGEDRLSPTTVAGADSAEIERRLNDADRSDQHPSIDAWRTDTIETIDEVVRRSRRSSWRQDVLESGGSSLCSVPLTYQGITHGVLTVVCDRPEGFDDPTVDVLAQLGTSIAHAITAIDRRRALEAETTLEVAFSGPRSALPISAFATDPKQTVRYERVFRSPDGTASVYASVRGSVESISAAEIEAAVDGHVSIASRREREILLKRDGEEWFGSVITDTGGVIREAVVDADGARLVIELPEKTEVRAFVDRLHEQYPALSLDAIRRHQRTEPTTSEFRDRLESTLSDRQHETLQAAHQMGYFRWPREHTSEEVADRLGITQPTVTKHLRLAEGKLFDLLFGPADTTDRPRLSER
ncbi:bacterio-opsin activator domain-containing protein [Halalkalirubrum salinum]|uniref:bacterio-opsin activator domain-containing protein n=1 Tax=Halalkalirubrum salinum TaxID=2563889 RepID=UPI0010FAE9A8|nr:bacterio-opsin activator domain-containing protein [Halalkalirubrum salinum]